MVQKEEKEEKWSNMKILSKLLAEVDEIVPQTSLPNASRFVDAAVREKLERTKQDIQDRADQPAAAE